MLQSLRSDVERLRRQLAGKDLKLRSLGDRLGALDARAAENYDAVSDVLKGKKDDIFYRLDLLESNHNEL